MVSVKAALDHGGSICGSRRQRGGVHDCATPERNICSTRVSSKSTGPVITLLRHFALGSSGSACAPPVQRKITTNNGGSVASTYAPNLQSVESVDLCKSPDV